MHDSAVRPPDPSCHPGTRDAILERLDDWSFEQPADSAILWLHGCAGIGKSAIAQQFAASCQVRSQLGGSFFWKRGDAGRGHWRNLVPTLAYQLAASFPAIGPIIQGAVETDRLIASKSMRHQLEKLIVLPFREAPKLNSRPILVLDGLDECEERAAQTLLLRSLIDVVRAEHIPVHILICSRSESHLCEILESSENSDVCRGFQIRPDASAYADISRYLTDEFARIQRAHTSRGVALHDDWPGEVVIEQLVERSSGTFIYASTIISYIDDEYSHPADRLDAVLILDPSSTTPLDDLYSQILSAVPDKSVLLRVLHAIVETHLDPEQIDITLQMRRGTSRIISRALHSLLQIRPVRIFDAGSLPVQLLHASFRDFLVEPQRSFGFCISGQDLRIALVHSMACALESGLRSLDFEAIIGIFLKFLVKIPPTESLFPILRNVHVQHGAYNSLAAEADARAILTWLQRYLHPPSDLVETWTDLRRLGAGHHMIDSKPHGDESIAQVLAGNPALISYLRVISTPTPVHYLSDRTALNLLGLTWDALRPLLQRSLDGLDYFLRDRQKCGTLYMSQEETLRFMAISRTNDVLDPHDFFQVRNGFPYCAAANRTKSSSIK
ncbi:hypothetical protein FB45DRAFT_802273 [Roridomyces roridus]|uniref:Nephrocystin 3-like N-terminal domain-containing protein n=1 Tax=Roridomyces roridus TaxID=1738132 RepID=A0AAD7FDV0_9AGAR|nr:hypothetical protein FB45DRAFT_802273 [Roridomyces roridus]